MILDTGSRSLAVALAAPAFVPLVVGASWEDFTKSGARVSDWDGGTSVVLVPGVDLVEVVPAPPAGVRRCVRALPSTNANVSPATAILYVVDALAQSRVNGIAIGAQRSADLLRVVRGRRSFDRCGSWQWTGFSPPTPPPPPPPPPPGPCSCSGGDFGPVTPECFQATLAGFGDPTPNDDACLDCPALDGAHVVRWNSLFFGNCHWEKELTFSCESSYPYDDSPIVLRLFWHATGGAFLFDMNLPALGAGFYLGIDFRRIGTVLGTQYFAAAADCATASFPMTLAFVGVQNDECFFPATVSLEPVTCP